MGGKTKFTTLAGTLLLIWLLFSPIVGLFLNRYYEVYFASNTSFVVVILFIIFGYLLTGTIFYYLIKLSGGFYDMREQKPIILDSMPMRQNLPWYVSILYIIPLVPALYAGTMIKFASYVPLGPVGGLLLGTVVFAGTCAANWYPPLRKRVNYWLTLQKNEDLAYAWAEQTLYSLNGFFIFFSGTLIIISILFLER